MLTDKRKPKRFGIDTHTGKLAVGGWQAPMPRSRAGRIVIGSILVAGGLLGFLPVFGFWMLPLGLLVLSHDLRAVRRGRRRMVVWWERRRQKKAPVPVLAEDSGEPRASAVGHIGENREIEHGDGEEGIAADDDKSVALQHSRRQKQDRDAGQRVR